MCRAHQCWGNVGKFIEGYEAGGEKKCEAPLTDQDVMRAEQYFLTAVFFMCIREYLHISRITHNLEQFQSIGLSCLIVVIV